MKFTCTQENLLRGLSRVSPIAGRGSQLPVLQHVLLQGKGGALHLTATDLEVGVHTVVGGKLDGEGAFAVPARGLLEYVQQLPRNNPVVISAEGGGVVVKTEGFRARFSSSDAEEFPLLPQGSEDDSFELPADVLCNALTRVVFAAAREETRPEIRSVFIKSDGGRVYIAATDSFRLAEEIITVDNLEEFSFLLPLPAAQELARLFTDQKVIKVSPHDNHVLFYGDDIELSSRLVDGRYPDYQQIIPTTHTSSVTVAKDELVRALKTLTIFLPRDSRRVELEVAPKTGKIVAQVVGSEAGQGDVVLSVDGDGEDVQVLVNINYILEGVQHFSSADCEIQFLGAVDPIVFRPKGGDQYLYIVMPIQSQ
ncbi:MAG: DNA polymerase III subunit beta [Candidatus Andersenbacteria bacterium]